MALVFNTPKSALNTTSKDIQNLSSNCPPCPEVNLTTADVEYTENGEYTVTPEEGYDGLSQVDITVNIDTQSIADEAYAEGEAAGIVTGKAQGVAEQKAKLTSTTITQNGTSTREDGWNSVTVNVQPTLQAKTATPTTSQQVITADSGNDGLSQVTVNAVTSAIDANITAGNIKKDVSILGVTGTYEDTPDLETKSVTYTANDTYTITPTAGKDGMSSVEVTVNVAGSNCPDWSSIGWDCNDVTASGIEADLAYTAQKKAEYEAGTITNFENFQSLFIPQINYSGKKIPHHMFSSSYIYYVPSVIDFSAATSVNYESMFYNSSKIRSISLVAPITGDAGKMFYRCSSLRELHISFSGVTNCMTMFSSCTALTTLPLLDCSNVGNIQNMFSDCASLVNLGGFYNLGSRLTSTGSGRSTLDLSSSTLLTKESIMNVINNLAAPASITATLKLSATSYALLTAEDIAIATAKNWTVTSA